MVKRSGSNSIVSEKANNINYLIWDEVSMSSRRILDVDNHIQIEITRGMKNCGVKPFGGIQVIMVGEFTQLSPVPNLMGDGQLCFGLLCSRKPSLTGLNLKHLCDKTRKEQEFLEFQGELKIREVY